MNTCKNCGKDIKGKGLTCSGACRVKWNRNNKKGSVTKVLQDVTVEVENVTLVPKSVTVDVTPRNRPEEKSELHIGNRFKGYQTLMHPNIPHCKDCDFIPDGKFIPNWFYKHLAGGKDMPKSMKHAVQQLKDLLTHTEQNSKLGLNL